MNKTLVIACLAVCGCLCASAQQPVVAIHISELTQALETMPAVAPTPSGSGTTGINGGRRHGTTSSCLKPSRKLCAPTERLMLWLLTPILVPVISSPKAAHELSYRHQPGVRGGKG